MRGRQRTLRRPHIWPEDTADPQEYETVEQALADARAINQLERKSQRTVVVSVPVEETKL